MTCNILILTSSYPVLAGESFEGACIEAFAEALMQQGHTVFVVTQCTGASVYRNTPGVVVKRFRWSKQAKPLSTLSLGRDIGKICMYITAGLKELRQLLRTVYIDFALCAWALPAGLFGLYLKKYYGIPYGVWALGADIWQYAYRPLPRQVLRRILSSSLQNYADGYALVEQVNAIAPTGASFLSTTRRLPPANQQQSNLERGKKHFLFVGRYHPNKGPDVLLEAVRLLKAQLREQARFHFFGIGDMHDQLQARVYAYDLAHCVHVNGAIAASTLAAYLETVDAIVIPSRIESIPVVLSDALQKKCFIIATNVGDMGRILSEYQTGCVVPPEDPIALAQALEKAYSKNKSETVVGEKLLYMFDVDTNATRVVDDFTTSGYLPRLHQPYASTITYTKR